MEKTDVIHEVLTVDGMASGRCLLFGDLLTYQQDALTANIPFLLRKHSDNSELLWIPSVPCISDFLSL